MTNRTYTELSRLSTFEERYAYLRIGGVLGKQTFGFDRPLNQQFYTSDLWRRTRQSVISRDLGFDLGSPDHKINGRFIIHHMNPMTVEDLANGSEENLDPEFLITTTHLTHNAIHYGDASLLPRPLVERKPGDTRLW